MKSITPGDVVMILNRALKADRAAITALVVNRVPCNKRLAVDPTIQVGIQDGGYHVGMLGVINGFFMDDEGWGGIVAVFDDPDPDNPGAFCDLIRFETLPEGPAGAE